MIRQPRKDERRSAQCRENILALLRWHGIEAPPIAAALLDRVRFEKTDAFVAAIEQRAGAGAFRQWPYFENHGDTARRSWRETVPWGAMQVVEHEDHVEADVDLCNPDGGAAPAFGHLIEVWWPGKTDPFRVRKLLVRRGVNVPLAATE